MKTTENQLFSALEVFKRYALHKSTFYLLTLLTYRSWNYSSHMRFLFNRIIFPGIIPG